MQDTALRLQKKCRLTDFCLKPIVRICRPYRSEAKVRQYNDKIYGGKIAEIRNTDVQELLNITAEMQKDFTE